MMHLIGIGTAVGLIHFVAMGVLYGLPFVAKAYDEAQHSELGVRKWPSRKTYIITQFLGTQVEVYILTAGFLWLRPLIGPGMINALLLGLTFASIRVYPRFWNMWIQSTYPSLLLKIELINGTLGTLVIVAGLELLGR